VSQLIACAELREECWRLLADALTESDPVRLDQHLELWSNSEFPASDSSQAGSSSTTHSQVRRGYSFQQALVTLTPRLITTPAIMAANILIFVTMIASGVDFFEPTVQSILDWGANFGPRTENGQWWRLVTCTFVHYGIVHIGFNMWVLWDVGRVVERLVGNVGFAVLYFVSGIAGSIASLTWNPVVVSAGASGAVFGVAGALLGFLALRRDTVPPAVLKQLWKSMIPFLACNIIIGMAIPGIDMAAHIGGFCAGSGCGLILSQPLALDMPRRRWLRNAAVSAAGTVTLLTWIYALPHIPRPARPAIVLPECTSPEVTTLLEQAIRSTASGASLKSIDGLREVSYDSEQDVRHGECIARMGTEDIRLNFTVEWQNRDQGRFQVRTLPADLPFCTQPEVITLLDQMVRGTPLGASLKSIDGHRELSYDSDAEIRYGECIAHTGFGDIPIRFALEWQDSSKGLYQIRILPGGPP